MNMNEYDNQEQPSVIAIAKIDNEFRAVELRERNGTFEVIWTKSSGDGDTNWHAFAAECGISFGSTEHAQYDIECDKIVVVGFDTAGTAFSRISMPAVEEKEIEPIVKLQAESRLPLPIEQMELAWCVGPTKDGQLTITMAAARKANVKAFVDKVRSIQPAQILLDCEGIVKSWGTLFSKNEKNAVIINAGIQNTQVCLVQDGKLSNSVALDMGIGDFAEGKAEQATETTERFVQDMRSVVDLFGYEKSAELPVFVLSDGSKTYVSLVSALKSEGLNARVVSPEAAKLTAQNTLSAEEIFKYRVPLGLAMMALDTQTDKLNLFGNLYTPGGEEKNRHWLYTPKIVYSITAVMLVLFVLVTYAVDVAKPGAFENRIKTSGSEADINLLIERQKLKKTIAQQRPDILHLLTEITECGQSSQGAGRGGRGQSSGIQLESFHFKKGQPVLIAGQASNNEQLYNFEKSLEKKTDIQGIKYTATQNSSTTNSTRSSRGTGSIGTGSRGTVSRGTSSRGTGSRGTKFTITFHYKNFTK